ncbi:SCAR-like protein [Drosera capensis]
MPTFPLTHTPARSREIVKMPLVRFEVKNEYARGSPLLYNAADIAGEDPKAVLQGVAVAGLVGLLRQLGDLAEFAAEVFHGLQEQVISTASRSRKLMTRVQNVEAALTPLEKVILAQASHIHLAYSPGSDWHARIKHEQNLLICSDLPQFLVDAYEDSREPPRLQWLDKFDTGGPGSCLKRYSDPSFFRRASAKSNILGNEQSQKERKAKKMKKRKSQKMYCQSSQSASFFDVDHRIQLSSSTLQAPSTPPQTTSTHDMRLKSEERDICDSVGLRDGLNGFMDCVFQPSTSAELKDMHSGSDDQVITSLKSADSVEQSEPVFGDMSCSASAERDICDSVGLREGLNGFMDCVFQPSTSVELKDMHSGSDDQVISSLKSADYAEQSEPVFGDMSCSASVEPDEVKIMESYAGLDEQNAILLKSDYFNEQTASVLDDIPYSSSVLIDKVKIRESFSVLEEQILTPRKTVNFDKNTIFVLDDVPLCATPEKASPRSPFVTWDEKTELLEPTGMFSDTDEVHEDPVTNCEAQGFTSEMVHGTNINQEDTSGEDASNLISCGNEHEEFESETERYVDAPNTLESESENEFGFQKKRETEVDSNAPATSEQRIELVGLGKMDHLSALIAPNHVGDGLLSNLDDSSASLVIFPDSWLSAESSCNLLEKETSDIAGGLVSALCLTDEHSKENSESSSLLNSPDIHNFAHANDADGLGQKSLACESASNGSSGTTTDQLVLSSTVQELPGQASNVGSVMFWTNGNLLGLAPSKPPDLGVRNGETCGSVNGNNDIVALSNHEQHVISMTPQFSESELDRGQVKIGDSHDPVDKFCNSEDIWATNSASMLPQAEQPSTADFKSAMTGGNHGRAEQSWFLSRLGRDFMMNGLRGSGSVSCGGKPKIERSVSSSVIESRQCFSQHHPSDETNQEEHPGSPTNSPPLSPPLEHMKISFHPISGFGTSQLKLRYPDGIDYHEGNIDAFPSFQLVPGLNDLQQGISSDSDDDTFGRSYSCRSQDHLSRLSDSDSDVWNSGCAGGKEHMLDDGSFRMSPIECISGSFYHEETVLKSILDNGTGERVTRMEGLQRQSSFLPALNTTVEFPHEEATTYSHQLTGSFFPQEPSQPPPLPPMQWRISKSESYEAAEGHSSASDGTFELSTPERSKRAISLQHNHTPANGVGRIEERPTMAMEIKQLAEQKSNGLKESRWYNKGKKEEDNEDFLHQIRTKSLNLRRAETFKPNITTGVKTNEAVTAIIEKANAIRQMNLLLGEGGQPFCHP